jgi:hypothetical protein
LPAPTTIAAAFAERERLLSDPEWKAAFERGDPEKRVQMNRVLSAGALLGVGETVNPADLDPKLAERLTAERAAQVAGFRESQIDDLRMRAAISEEVAQQVREGRPVTAAEKRWANEERDRLFADDEWVKRWRSGGRQERSELALLQIVRSAALKAA